MFVCVYIMVLSVSYSSVFGQTQLKILPKTVFKGNETEITCTYSGGEFLVLRLIRIEQTGEIQIASKTSSNSPRMLSSGFLNLKPEAVSQNGFKFLIGSSECTHAGIFFCKAVLDAKKDSDSDPTDFNIIDNSGSVAIRNQGMESCPQGEDCSACSTGDTGVNTVIAFVKPQDKLVLSCTADLPFPDKSDRPNTFSWEVYRDITEGYRSVSGRGESRPRYSNVITTTSSPRVMNGCAKRRSFSYNLEYIVQESDPKTLRFKCKVQFRFDNKVAHREGEKSVCVIGGKETATGAIVQTTTDGTTEAGGSSKAGMIAGIIIAVIAAIVLVIVLVYFLWYRKRSHGDKYSANAAEKNARSHDDRADSDIGDNEPNMFDPRLPLENKPVPNPRSKNDGLHNAERPIPLEPQRGDGDSKTDGLHYAVLPINRAPQNEDGDRMPRINYTDEATAYAQIQIT